MKTGLIIKSALHVALVLILLAPASGPAWAKEKEEPIEKFRARALNIERGSATFLDIVIYEWTTPEERQGLLETFVEGGQEALYDALYEIDRKAYVRLPGTLAYDMKYAWQVEVDGKRRIVLGTDRPLGFLEVMRGFRSRDYNVSMIILDVDPETGKGEGTAMGGAELSINKETGQLEIEIHGTQPTRLTSVEPVKKKKKKKE